MTVHQESGDPGTSPPQEASRLGTESGLLTDLIVRLGNVSSRQEICDTVMPLISELTGARTIRLTSITDDYLWEETVLTLGNVRSSRWTQSPVSELILASEQAIVRTGETGIPGVTAYIGVPLKHSGRVVGILEAEDPRLPERIGSYLSTMRLIAGVAAMALSTARLLNSIESKEREWQRTFDAMGDGVAIISPDHVIVRANRALAQMTGARSSDDLLGRHCYEVLHGAEQAITVCPLESCLASKESREIERQEPFVNNIWVHHRVDPIVDPRGEAMGAVHSFRDITAHMETDKLKEEFIGLVSHELRNPLTVMIGALQTAIEDGDRLSRDDMAQLLSDAAQEAHEMSDMVGNMLDLSRSDANRLSLEIELMDLSEVVNAMSRKFQVRYPSRTIVTDLPPDLPLTRADRLRVERVLHNLLHNAIKYSPDGGDIRIRAKATDSELIVCVEDQGIGISDEDQSKLFQPFHRAADARKIDTQGSGLGLVVCRRVVEAHGGRIWVESQVGKGSTFFFTVPLAQG